MNHELRTRIESYTEIEASYRCFFTEDDDLITKSLERLSIIYENDIDSTNLKQEFQHFKTLCKITNSESIQEKFDQAKLLRSTFPNVVTLLEIFHTIPLSNASAERSFSALKRIKTYLRSTMAQNKLDGLSLLYIENETMDNVNFNATISDFARRKARKKYIV